MSTVKVGMIGAGAIAGDHCRGVQKHAKGEVVAIADVSRERASQVAQEFGATKIFSKWEDMIADPDIDAVAVALPNFL
ncbi:MAG: Gfo/Idh/MocA family oxidoreductase, partial [Planctomycetes bacterium]|nr:Gfo/Idh/MocA family oxidoreductase [Planctomycetota bacterium]